MNTNIQVMHQDIHLSSHLNIESARGSTINKLLHQCVYDWMND